MTKKCLFCYETNGEIQGDFHIKCCKSFFRSTVPPVLQYGLEDMNELAKQVVARSITVPGVQAKLSLYLTKKGTLPDRLTLVGLWSNYILKPPVATYPLMPEIEDVTMHLAEICKIRTVPHSLIRLKTGELAYITKRIDRDDKNSRIHMEDMCQLTERLTEDKYKGSMENIGRILLKYSSNPMFDIVQFYEIAVFSFLTGNADMHLKNFSLIYNTNGMTGLSPAYDLLATRLLIPEKDDNEETALTLNGKKRNFTKKDFILFGKHLNLNNKQIENTFNTFKGHLNSCFECIDRSFLTREFRDIYKELIRERAKRIF